MADFAPGPMVPLDVDTVIGPNLEYDFAATAATRLGDQDAADARITSALGTMADAFEEADLDTFIGAVDAASGSHTAHAQQPDEPATAELAAADLERQRLETLAATLPPDGVDPAQVTEFGEGSTFEGVDVDYEALAGLPDAVDRRIRGLEDAIGRAVARPSPSSPPPSQAPPDGAPADKPPAREPGEEPLPIPPPSGDTGGGAPPIEDDHGGITPPDASGGGSDALPVFDTRDPRRDFEQGE